MSREFQASRPAKAKGTSSKTTPIPINARFRLWFSAFTEEHSTCGSMPGGWLPCQLPARRNPTAII
jgi:hypothetical protein